jgi:lipopolysaccharide biosynthesis protein
LVDIRIQPNRGRDIGPLLRVWETICQKYDLIGHLHTKKRHTLRRNLSQGLEPVLLEIAGG